MMLNKDEIATLNLISAGFDAKSARDAGYDVRIQLLMQKNDAGGMEKLLDDIDLPPRASPPSPVSRR